MTFKYWAYAPICWRMKYYVQIVEEGEKMVFRLRRWARANSSTVGRKPSYVTMVCTETLLRCGRLDGREM